MHRESVAVMPLLRLSGCGIPCQVTCPTRSDPTGVVVTVIVGLGVGVPVAVYVNVGVPVAVSVDVARPLGVLVAVRVTVDMGVKVGPGVREVVTGGVTVGLPVRVGVAVLQGERLPIRRPQARSVPVSNPALSVTVSVHAPLAFCPLNAESAVTGLKVDPGASGHAAPTT